MHKTGVTIRHVFLCADANFVVPMTVTLRSFAETQKDPSLFRVTVLSAGIPELDQNRIRASVSQLSLQFIPIEHLLPTDIPSARHLNSAAYGRLFGVDALPPSTGRAIYI